MMFKFLRCSIKWCSTHHYETPIIRSASSNYICSKQFQKKSLIIWYLEEMVKTAIQILMKISFMPSCPLWKNGAVLSFQETWLFTVLGAIWMVHGYLFMLTGQIHMFWVQYCRKVNYKHEYHVLLNRCLHFHHLWKSSW